MNGHHDVLAGGSLTPPLRASSNSDVLCDWIIPCSLASLIFGQIFFSFSKFHFGVAHPSWPLWGIVATSLAIYLFRRETFGLSKPDTLFLIFLGILVLLFAYHGKASALELGKYVFVFVCLPYLAGRSMSARGISNFIKASLAICIVSMAIICFELINLSTEARMSDRIGLFATEFPSLSLFGDPTTINVGTVAGGAIFLSISLLFAKPSFSLSWIKVAGVALIAGIALDLIIIAGSRSGLAATVIVALCAIGLTGLKHLPQKVTLLVTLAVFAAIPLHTDIISEARKNLLLGRGAADAASIAAHKRMLEKSRSGTERARDELLDGTERPGEGPLGEKLPDEGCELYGNSFSTRAEYLNSAVDLYRKHPLTGVGPGNFGIYYCGSSKAHFVPPHNIVLQSFAELGTFGGLAFCGIVLCAVYGAIRRIGYTQRLAVTMMVFFGIISLLSGDMYRSYDFYGALGILVAAGSLVAVPASRKRQLADEVDGPTSFR